MVVKVSLRRTKHRISGVLAGPELCMLLQSNSSPGSATSAVKAILLVQFWCIQTELARRLSPSSIARCADSLVCYDPDLLSATGAKAGRPYLSAVLHMIRVIQ